MRKLFINCTQHQLTDEQLKEAKMLADDIIDIKKYPVFESIKKSAKTRRGLITQAMELVIFLQLIVAQYDKTYIHLPIGSPAFMFILAPAIIEMENVIPVFSHSEREVEEVESDDGSVIKKSVFKFKGFINFEDGKFREYHRGE